MNQHPLNPDGFVYRRDVVAHGTTDDQLAQMVSDGQLDRVWRGTYSPTQELDREAHYRRKVVAAARHGGEKRVLAFESAASVLELPLYDPALDKVHFIASLSGRHMPDVVVHQARLAPQDIVVVRDHPTTSPARTACDIARSGSFWQAVAALDSACRMGVTDAELRDVIGRLKRHHGIAVLRAAYPYATALSQSVGESISKCVFRDLMDIPMPELQVDVQVQDGSVKWCDAGWRDSTGALRVVGEFDGKIKYHRLAREQGRLPEEVIYQEKLREDAIRACGIIVVRWVWADLLDPRDLHCRLRAALIQGDVLRVKAA